MLEQMHPDEIKTGEPFKSLFPIEPATLTAVAEHMEEHGYDPAQPLVVWLERGVLLDGHTRLAASRKLNFARVPVVEKGFRTEDEAVEYAIHCQRDRRNLSDADLLRWIQEVDKRKSAGRPQKSAQPCANSGKSAEATAAVVGVSARKVEQARTVIDQADEETKAKVAKGEMSINKAYNETRQKARPKTYFDDAPPLASAPKTDKSARKSVNSKLSAQPVDQVGNELPSKEHIRTAFRRRDEIKELMTAVSRLKTEVIKKADNGDPLYAALSTSQWQADCGNLHRALRAIRPYAVCPYCQGVGCDACHDRGWVGEFVYEHVPEEMKGGKR